MQPAPFLNPDEFMPAWPQYTPSVYYQKSWDDIKYSETGPEEAYADALTAALLAGSGYAGLVRVPLPKGLTKPAADDIQTETLFRYLDSRDELPAFPTATDWASFVKAPVDAVAPFMQSGHGLLSHLPTLEEGTLQPFFANAVKKLYQEMMPLNRTPDLDMLMTEKAVLQRFTALATGRRSALAGLPHPQLVQLIADAVQAFAPKLRAYRVAYQNKKQGTFDALLADVKERHLSKLDAIKFIVHSFLD